MARLVLCFELANHSLGLIDAATARASDRVAARQAARPLDEVTESTGLADATS